MSHDELKARFPNASPGFLKANADAGGLPPNPQRKRNSGHEPVGTDAGKAPYQKRRFVRITSLRLVLLDERNLFDKHFTDSLVEAGILVDDSPEHCQIEVRQQKVDKPYEQFTMIEAW